MRKVGVRKLPALIDRLVRLSFGVSPTGDLGKAVPLDCCGLTLRQPTVALRVAEGMGRNETAAPIGVSNAGAQSRAKPTGWSRPARSRPSGQAAFRAPAASSCSAISRSLPKRCAWPRRRPAPTFPPPPDRTSLPRKWGLKRCRKPSQHGKEWSTQSRLSGTSHGVRS